MLMRLCATCSLLPKKTFFCFQCYTNLIWMLLNLLRYGRILFLCDIIFLEKLITRKENISIEKSCSRPLKILLLRVKCYSVECNQKMSNVRYFIALEYCFPSREILPQINMFSINH
jgi:hypothetical protein